MNIALLRFLSAAGTALLLTASTFASSDERGRAAAMYAAHGLLYVEAAGPYVERSTYRVQVLAKLGNPAERPSEDIWLYRGHRIERVGLEGTLVIRFRDGRVQSLALASPATVAALRAAGTAAKERLAARP